MDTLVYFLLWAVFIFFMMRFGCGAHMMGHEHSSPRGPKNISSSRENLRWIPPAEDVDPVCGMTVDTAKAKSAVNDGHVYYFCSQDCREKFEVNPASYLVPAASSSSSMEHRYEH